MFSGYTVKGKYYWDPWFIKNNDEYHCFYLQTKKTRKPEQRHLQRIEIGHAVSKNLANWKQLETALKPGRKSEWDSYALWTGSTLKKGSKYYLFYTGRHHTGKNCWEQKIGFATSKDLITWKKHSKNPVLKADEKWYETNFNKNKIGKIGAWRDPFVFFDKKNKKYYMTLSARSKSNKKEYNACIALAESKNLKKWKACKPLLAPFLYDEMETSQLIFFKNHYFLFFSISERKLSAPNWAKIHGELCGLHCYYSKNLEGPYKPVNKNGSVFNNCEEMFNIRIIEQTNDCFNAVGWINYLPTGKFIGQLSKPFKIKISTNKIERIKTN